MKGDYYRKSLLAFLFYLWFISNIPLTWQEKHELQLKEEKQSTTVDPDKPDKCLKHLPDIIIKKYSHLNGHETDIVVETSARPLHQLTTEIFKIFLEEVLGYSKVRIIREQYDFELETIIDRLTPSLNEKIVFPQSMINLEVWIPPEYDLMTLEDTQLISEYGSVAPPGRFGWFIPYNMSEPIKRFYKKFKSDVREVHWTFLRDPKLMASFDVTDKYYRVVEKNFRFNSSICYPGEKCDHHDVYIPEQCKKNTCALLLTSHFNSTKFVLKHIDDLKLYVKVAWLGYKLKETVKTLEYLYQRDSLETTKSLIILHYTPSDLILRETNFFSVVFKHCEPLDSLNSIGCKYELNRLVKLSWSKVDSLTGLKQAVKKFKFNEKEYNDLISLYEQKQSTNATFRDIGCEWMNKKGDVWSVWKTESDTTNIFIGGIFPVTDSSYNGGGIVKGAMLAIDAINNSTRILPNNRLNLIASNGRCRADSVMKSFIDYIVDGYYDNLIGVLGPACSDTVEPLAGVSKHYHIMVISYSAEGASFSDREKYPYFFRTIGENKHYKHVYLNLFKRLGWKRVAALTEDGQKYTEYISHMQEMLEENGITFISNTKFPRERETFQMTRYLEDLKRKSARIIILDVIDEIARTVMCEAFRMKMTSAEGYVWFLPPWLNVTWYDTDYFNSKESDGYHNKESVNCSTDDMIKAATGYFSMSHAYFAPNDSKIEGNMTVGEWKEKYAAMDSLYARKTGSSNYAGYAYDAVWTYALALDKLIKQDPKVISELHSKNTTDKLVQLIQETDFKGVSGRIKFRGGPSRFSTINIMQWYNFSLHIVGHFYPNLTDDMPDILGGNLELNMSSLKWFLPDNRVPQDGTIPPPMCAIESFAKGLNVSCELAIIILNIILVSIILVIVGAVMYFMKKRYDKKMNETKKYIRHFGFDLLLNPSTALSDLDKWEVPRNSVVITRKLGEGAFGTVYGGEATIPGKDVWEAVAVKTLKVGSSSDEKLDFLAEAEVMKRFDHKNIVKLLGVCTKEEPIYTIMEFMLYGDLKTYLLARRHLVNNRNVEESEEVSSKKLTSMALDVARGLSYLAQLKYVHRDIASRNCLINVHRVVKLGDFGMTRPMFENDYYKFSRKGMLPVRWMSPESLALGVFTPASDVWSYGVLLYEIVTFGSFPYQGMNNNEVLEYVKSGNTITIPMGVKPQLQGLLKSCWRPDPKERTRASEIAEFLANNPRLIAPCLDLPLASIQLEDTDQVEFNLPEQFRKCSTGTTTSVNNSTSGGANLTANANGIASLRHQQQQLINHQDGPTTNGKNGTTSSSSSTPLENYCPKEPLLGMAKSSSSLLNFGKYVQHDKKKDVSNGGRGGGDGNNDGEDDDEDDYMQHSTSNGYVISKV